MSKPIIRREALAAYQRWEPSSFDFPDGEGGSAPTVAPEEAARAAEALAAAAHAREQALSALRESAREAGHRDGYEAGYQEGMAEGLEAGRASGAEQVAVATAHLHTLNAGLQDAFATVDTAMADTLLELSLQFAQAMLRQTLAVQPERIVPLIREFLRDASDTQRPATLRLHPDDVAVVREALGPECELAGWSLFADVEITRGGCLLQARHGETDGRIETRWRELNRALERAVPWMEAA